MDLSDKIWITRKARIYAERRLQKKAIFSQILMIVYSAVLVFFSIANIYYSFKMFDMLPIFASMSILLASVFLASQRYTERALAMRNCYIHLDELFSKVKRAEEIQNTELLKNFETEYSNILVNVENHTDYDYLCIRYMLRNNDNVTLPKFIWSDYVDIIWAKLWRSILLIIYFLLPFLVIVIWNFFVTYVSKG